VVPYATTDGCFGYLLPFPGVPGLPCGYTSPVPDYLRWTSTLLAHVTSVGLVPGSTCGSTYSAGRWRNFPFWLPVPHCTHYHHLTPFSVLFFFAWITVLFMVRLVRRMGLVPLVYLARSSFCAFSALSAYTVRGSVCFWKLDQVLCGAPVPTVR